MKKWLKHKYPLVRQYDRIDCGPAALLSVLKFYGGDASLVAVRDWCRTDTNGSTMFDLVTAARRMGFKASGATGDYEALAREKMPCIAHVVLEQGLQHFLILYRIDKKGVYVGDPGRGRYRMSKSEFMHIWRHRAVILLEPENRLTNQPAPTWMSWIFAYLGRETGWIIQSLFLGICYTFLGLVTALFVQWLIDRFIPEKDIDKIIYTGLFLTFLLLIREACGYLRQRFLVILNKRVNLGVTNDFLSHLFHLPKLFFDKRKTGDITARINDSIKIHQAISLLTNSVIIDGLVITGSLLFMFCFAPLLALIALILIPVYALLLFVKTRQIRQQQNEVMKNHALVESTYIDSIRGVDDIIGFRSAAAFIKLNQGVFGHFQTAIEKLGFTQAGVSVFALGSSSVISVFFLTTGAIGVIAAELQLGELMAAYALLNNIIPAVGNLVGAHLGLQGARVAAMRLMDLLLVEREKNSGKEEFNLINKLHISNLCFSYGKSAELLRNINLTLKKGRLTALWGPSGSGKSTLVHLIQRKYEPCKGRILIDDIPVDRYDLHDCRSRIGVLPQSIHVFNASLADNILLGRPAVGKEELQKTIEKSGLRFLERFDHGYYTLLGEEGRRLSGGELQMLGLLRAMIGEPDILIIDEGFSSMDVQTEALLFRSVVRYARDHIVLLVTHDIAALCKTDYVYLLNKRTIVEQGEPDRLLMDKSSFFYALSKEGQTLCDDSMNSNKGELECQLSLHCAERVKSKRSPSL
ncbi:ATP-binding cassette domain-containing protein [candidate division KSB1 bacterium]|nr:ATP-binding cassette domain-containing protein [candidate division KSB1 bacterium]